MFQSEPMSAGCILVIFLYKKGEVATCLYHCAVNFPSCSNCITFYGGISVPNLCVSGWTLNVSSHRFAIFTSLLQLIAISSNKLLVIANSIPFSCRLVADQFSLISNLSPSLKQLVQRQPNWKFIVRSCSFWLPAVSNHCFP